MKSTSDAAICRKEESMSILLSRKQGSELLGVSETTFWRLAEFDDSFPSKIRLSARRVAWRRASLLAWISSREGV